MLLLDIQQKNFVVIKAQDHPEKGRPTMAMAIDQTQGD
jgi:hypothetical protein